jgi:hypothetical protein
MDTLPPIFSNRNFRWVSIAVVLGAISTLAINVFVVGGDRFLYHFNSSLNAPLAALVAIYSTIVWRQARSSGVNHSLWAGIMAGWILWTVAEFTWLAYSLFGQEAPYPGPADLFWIAGYIPMGFGLLGRIRSMPLQPSRRQVIVIITLAIAAIGGTFLLILLPILQSYDPGRALESILNILYPLADLFLLVFVWRLFYTYQEGDYGFGWQLIALGLVFNSLTDLVFTYSSWMGTYYPDMQANLISRLGVDVPYIFSYLLWFLGLYAIHILQQAETRAAPQQVHETPATGIRVVRNYGNILVYTDSDNLVLNVSSNFDRLFDTGDVKGRTLAGLLGIPEQEESSIFEKIRGARKAVRIPVRVQSRLGASLEVDLIGMAIRDPQWRYQGSNLLLRFQAPDPSFNRGLSEECRGMVQYLLKAGDYDIRSEVGRFLTDYYLVYLKSLFDIALQHGGNMAGQALLEQLTRVSRSHGWDIQFDLVTILDSREYSLEVLREALPTLLNAARQFVSQIVNPAVVHARMQTVRSQFDQVILNDVAYYGDHKNGIIFAGHREGLPG